jgi:RHS repeat-associated protein
MVSRSNAPAASKRRLTFEYDWQGRRIRKTVEKDVSGNWSEIYDILYLYDGWNLLAELDANNGNAVIRSYAWGLDLSGTEQGAGGVGGLLMTDDATEGTQFVAYDGNGNITALVDATGGTLSARYHYGPFGEELRVSGSLGEDNPVRFSTKYRDRESGLVYYGFRYYNSLTGRWISVDPLASQDRSLVNRGSAQFVVEKPRVIDLLNVYQFTTNNSLDGVDYLGLTVYLVHVPATIPCVDHRIIIGDDGEEGSYFIDFGPVGGGSNRVCGPGTINYSENPLESAWENIQGLAIVDARVEGWVLTSERVDQQLAEDAKNWHQKGQPPSFILGFRDCQQFAWDWLSWARTLQNLDNSTVTLP